MELGYALSAEEHAPADLVRNARAAEEAGFGFGSAFEIWPNALVEGSASQELPLPKDFEQLVDGERRRARGQARARQ